MAEGPLGPDSLAEYIVILVIAVICICIGTVFTFIIVITITIFRIIIMMMNIFVTSASFSVLFGHSGFKADCLV